MTSHQRTVKKEDNKSHYNTPDKRTKLIAVKNRRDRFKKFNI